MKLSRILVPTDLSAASLTGLDYAVELARPFKAEVVVFYVVEPIVYATPTDLYGATADLGSVLQEQERSGRAQLKKIQERYAKKVPSCAPSSRPARRTWPSPMPPRSSRPT